MSKDDKLNHNGYNYDDPLVQAMQEEILEKKSNRVVSTSGATKIVTDGTYIKDTPTTREVVAKEGSQISDCSFTYAVYCVTNKGDIYIDCLDSTIKTESELRASIDDVEDELMNLQERLPLMDISIVHPSILEVRVH